MKNVPQPQEQARILKAALKGLGLNVGHQAALQVVAQVMGVRDWPTLSASFDAAQAHRNAQATALAAIVGPEDGNLYESLVTVDQTLSARIRVRAHSAEEAQQLLRTAGHAQYPHGFELDEGNYRGSADFYLGDSNAVVNLSEPVFDDDGATDFSAGATWHDETYKYRIEVSRDEPDCSDDNRRARTTEVLRVSRDGVEVSREARRAVWDELENYVRDVIEDGDFDDVFAELAAKVERKLKRQQK